MQILKVIIVVSTLYHLFIIRTEHGWHETELEICHASCSNKFSDFGKTCYLSLVAKTGLTQQTCHERIFTNIGSSWAHFI